LVAVLTAGMVTAAEVPAKPILVLDPGGHTAIVRKVCFTPDGKQLITVAEDKTIRCWDVQSGDLLRVLRPPIGHGPEGKLYAASLSADGRTLAVGGYGAGGKSGLGHIYLITWQSGEIQRVLKGHANGVNSLAFSPDGRHLASGSYDRTARLWNVSTAECEQVFRGHSKAIYGVALSPDGQRLATASFDHTARIWSVADGQISATLEGHTAEVRSIAWSPDGRTIATGGDDQSVRLWNADGTFRNSFANLGNFVDSVTFTSDSSGLLYTTGGSTRSHSYASCCWT